MRILFYDWALYSVGGGQKFNCKIAEHLSKSNQVDILTLFPVDKNYLEKIYSVNLSKTRIIPLFKEKKPNPTLIKILVSKRVSKLSEGYDVLFNADAQEVVRPLAKKNIMYCHFFEPRWYRPSKGFFDFFKLLGIYLLKTFKGNYSSEYEVYCNSNYTGDWLKKLWHINSKVIYPPVEIPKRKEFKKQKIIISTGRISPDKNYEFVINVFKQALSNPALKDYKLLICGKADNPQYIEKLKILSNNLPVEFITDLSDKQLKEIYSKSSAFIQAKGLGIDENKYPGLFEHFGMTTAEAMSYGCIPIVLDKAGYKEIVDSKTGFKFNNEKEAVDSLIYLCKNNSLMSTMSKAGIKRAKLFSLERMQKEIDEIFDD